MKPAKTIFNMDTRTKKALQRKARSQGLTLSTVLNLAAKAYVQDRIFIEATERGITHGLNNIRNGRTISQDILEKELRAERKG